MTTKQMWWLDAEQRITRRKLWALRILAFVAVVMVLGDAHTYESVAALAGGLTVPVVFYYVAGRWIASNEA